MNFKIDYTKLSYRGLRDLINQGDDEAEKEFHRRKDTGEIPSNYISIEEFEKKCREKGLLK